MQNLIKDCLYSVVVSLEFPLMWLSSPAFFFFFVFHNIDSLKILSCFVDGRLDLSAGFVILILRVNIRDKNTPQAMLYPSPCITSG